MNILIPMAGRGQRFADAGFSEPKPFIKVLKNQRMIDFVLEDIYDGISYPSYREKRIYIFVCLKEFIDIYSQEFQDIVEDRLSDYRIKVQSGFLNGMAKSSLLAEDLIDNDEELIITDCDHACHQPFWIKDGLNYFKARGADGGLWTFWNNHPKWSYCRIDNNHVVEVVEKQKVSEYANTGAYYFRKGSDFVKSAKSIIEKNIMTNNEFYVSSCYNQMINSGQKVVNFHVNGHIALGTPDDLQKFQNNQSLE